MTRVKYNTSQMQTYEDELISIGTSLCDIYESLSPRARKMDSSQRSIKTIRDNVYIISDQICRDGNNVSALGSFIGDCIEKYDLCNNKVDIILNNTSTSKEANPVKEAIDFASSVLNNDKDLIEILKASGIYGDVKKYFDIFEASFYATEGFITEDEYGSLYGILLGSKVFLEEYLPDTVAIVTGVDTATVKQLFKVSEKMLDTSVEAGYEIVKFSSQFFGVDYDKVLKDLTGSTGMEGVNKMFDMANQMIADSMVDGMAKVVKDVRSFFGDVADNFATMGGLLKW